MVESHCEILWADNSGANLGCNPTSDYAAQIYDAQKQAIISHKRLRSKMLGLWIKNPLTTNAKRKLMDLNFTYTFNAQDDGVAMFFVIVKMVQPDTREGWSDIKYKLEHTNMYHFKHDIPKSNLKIAEWMNDISIAGETY